MAYISKVTSRGQITLPQDLRDEEGITANDYVVIRKVGGHITVDKADLGYEKVTRRFQKDAKEKGLTKKDLLKELESVRKARYIASGGGPHETVH